MLESRYGHTVGLRLGIDLDGVLADMHRELLRQADALFGPGTTRSVEAESPAPGAEGGQRPTILEVDPAAQSLKLSSRQQRQLWDHVGAISNFWETLAEIESGTVARLWLLGLHVRVLEHSHRINENLKVCNCAIH